MKTVKLFISSTFKDLKKERNFIMQNSIIKARKTLREYNINLIPIDLRWGITESIKNGQEIIEKSLDLVELCNPYFLCLLGTSYYGTKIQFLVDNSEKYLDYLDLSVTALEVTKGILEKEYNDKAAFIEIDKPIKLISDSSAELSFLKRTIKSQGYKIYSSKSTKQLDEIVYNCIMGMFENDILNYQNQNNFKIIDDYTDIECYVDSDDIQRQINLLLSTNNTVFLSGPSGIGKTTHIKNWVKLRIESSNIVIPVFVGSIFKKITSFDIINEIYQIVCNICNQESQYFSSSSAYISEINKMLNYTSSYKYIVIDGINQVNDSYRLKELFGIASNNIKFLISIIDPLPFNDITHHLLSISRLDNQNKLSILNKHLNYYGKSMTEEQLNLLVNTELSSIPLFLITAIDELVKSAEFETLKKRLDEINNLSSIDQIFKLVINRLEDTFAQNLIQITLLSIFVSADGISEFDLRNILIIYQIDYYQLDSVLNNLERFLVYRGIKLDFFHEYMREAVNNKYSLEEKNNVRSILINYYTSNNDIEIALEELVYQYSYMSCTDNLLELLSDFEKLNYLFFNKKTLLMKVLFNFENHADVFDFIIKIYQKSMSKHATMNLLVLLLYEIGMYSFITNFLYKCEGHSMSKNQHIDFLNHLGNALHDECKYDESIKVLKNNYIITKDYYKDTPIKMVSTLNNYSNSLCRLGNLKEASMLIHENLNILLQYSDRHYHTALTTLGTIQYLNGDIQESHLTFKKVYDYRIDKFSEHSREFCNSLSNYACILIELNNISSIDLGKKLNIQCYNLRNSFLNSNHPDCADTLHNLGNIMYLEEKYNDAYKYYQMAYQIRVDSFGIDHRESLMTYYNIILTNIRLNKLIEAQNGLSKFNDSMTKIYSNLELNSINLNNLKSALRVLNNQLKLEELPYNSKLEWSILLENIMLDDY